MIMPFGKYKGKRVEEIPHSYLRWCIGNLADIDAPLRQAIYRALGQPEPRASTGGDILPVVARVEEGLKGWYRRMSLKHHPDRGGTNEAQIVVNDCYESLIGMIREMGGVR
jgi:putative quorum-sensing-regulated virulence factor